MIEDNATVEVQITADYLTGSAQEAMWREFVKDRAYTEAQRDAVVADLLTCQETELELLLPQGCLWDRSKDSITSPVGVDLSDLDLEAMLDSVTERVADQFQEIEGGALAGADEVEGILPHQRAEVESWLPQEHGLTPDQVNDLIGIATDLQERHGSDQVIYDTALTVAYRLLLQAVTPETIVRELRGELRLARHAEARVLAAMRQAAVLCVDGAESGVHSADGFAQLAGIDLETVREWDEQTTL